MQDSDRGLDEATTRLREAIADYRAKAGADTTPDILDELTQLESQLAGIAPHTVEGGAAAMHVSSSEHDAYCKSLSSALNAARAQFVSRSVPRVAPGLDHQTLTGAGVDATAGHAVLLQEIESLERAMAEAGCPI